MKAGVTLTININFNTKEDTTEKDIENTAYLLLHPFLDQYVNREEFGKDSVIESFSVNVEEQYTSIGISIDNKTAEQIELEDDGQPHGGIGFFGETLDNFIQELREDFSDYGEENEDDEFIYDIPLGIVNAALNECGVKQLTPEEIGIGMEKAECAEKDRSIARKSGNIYVSKTPYDKAKDLKC